MQTEIALLHAAEATLNVSKVMKVTVMKSAAVATVSTSAAAMEAWKALGACCRYRGAEELKLQNEAASATALVDIIP